LIRTGEVSASEVTGAHIDRIEEANPDLNAVVIELFDEARAQAAAADESLARGRELGPLHGVPMTLKESYRVAGTQVTLGATAKVGAVHHDEGPLVAALRDAGAVFLGKTNIIQALAGWESVNPVYGRTSNPWDLERSPGGSSGGEAAILAAGGSALGLAGDLGGSIRVPAHFAGVHGFKPTSGRLTNSDLPGGLLERGQLAVIAQPGPIGRSVADLRLAMGVLAATSLGSTDDFVAPVPWQAEIGGVSSLRIGMYDDNGLFPVSPSIRRVLAEAAAALEARGASVEPVAAPDPDEVHDLFLRAMAAGGSAAILGLLEGEKPIDLVAGMVRGANMPGLLRRLVSAQMDRRGQHHVARILRSARSSSGAGLIEVTEQVLAFRAAHARAWDAAGVDAVICPPAATTALLHGASEHLFPAMSYAIAYNVLGFPAGVVSVSTVRDGEETDRHVGDDMADITAVQVEAGSTGLPIGIQVVALPWQDGRVLDVMSVLEECFQDGPDYPAQR
jgi:fatty acid amide hydrolase